MWFNNYFTFGLLLLPKYFGIVLTFYFFIVDPWGVIPCLMVSTMYSLVLYYCCLRPAGMIWEGKHLLLYVYGIVPGWLFGMGWGLWKIGDDNYFDWIIAGIAFVVSWLAVATVFVHNEASRKVLI